MGCLHSANQKKKLFESKSCENVRKGWKKEILTSIWHSSSGQNIQNLVFNYLGLLHSMDGSQEGEHKFATSEIQRLLIRCSDDPRMHVRSEAAMELIELISGSGEKDAEKALSDDDTDNEDFNDNNIRY